MHAISSYRGNRPTNRQTNKQTHPQTHRQDRLQYTPLQLAHSVITTVTVWPQIKLGLETANISMYTVY